MNWFVSLISPQSPSESLGPLPEFVVVEPLAPLRPSPKSKRGHMEALAQFEKEQMRRIGGDPSVCVCVCFV